MKIFLNSKYVHLIFIAVLLFAVFNSVLGADFGFHWDEHLFTDSFKRPFDSGILVAGWYYYPSFCYNLVLASTLPYIVNYYMTNIHNFTELQGYINEVVFSPLFLIRGRILFGIVSMTSLIWIYLLVLRWRKSWHEALLAASLAGLSWEISYHSRWMATDMIMMQFGALTMMCIVFAFCSPLPRRWIFFSAISAGLAVGTKYPGGLLIIPVLLAGFFINNENKSKKMIITELAAIASLFVIVYLLTTPGMLLEPVIFKRHVIKMMQQYSTGHWGYSVTPGLQHLMLMTGYLALAVFSKYPYISATLFILVVPGVYAVIRDEKRTFAMVFLVFPVLYISYMATQKVMIVRNLLVLVPFIAIFAARGFNLLLCRLGSATFFKYALSAAIIAMLLVNALWLVNATESIRTRKKTNYIAQLSKYLDEHSDCKFVLSPAVAGELARYEVNPRHNMTTDINSDAQIAVFYSEEVSGVDWKKWTANRFNYMKTWFGPYEVNLNYYPSWRGDNRIVLMPVEDALKL